MIVKFGQFILVGTSHVAKHSIEDIKKAIEEYKPEVVGIELDMDRLKHVLKPNKKKKTSSFRTIKEIGISGYLFALVGGYVQNTIGKKLSINPGADMKAAYTLARKQNIPTALIDQHISITLKKLSALSFLRKIKFFWKMSTTSFKKEYRNKLKLNPEKVPDEEVIIEMLKILKKEVPDMYRIFIHERNVYMAKRLLKLQENHDGHIMAVVGAGHVEGMKEYLEKHSGSNTTVFSFVSD